MDDRTKAILIMQELAKMGESVTGKNEKKLERNYADTVANDMIIKESASIGADGFMKKKINTEFRFKNVKTLNQDQELRAAIYALLAAEMMSFTSTYEELFTLIQDEGATEAEAEEFLTICLTDIKKHTDRFVETSRLLVREGFFKGTLK